MELVRFAASSPKGREVIAPLRAFGPPAADLVARGVSVYAPDHRGHGRSGEQTRNGRAERE